MRYRWVLGLALAACGGRGASSEAGRQQPQQAPQPPSQQAAVLAPPAVAFTVPAPWRSATDPPEVVTPPDLASETWRVFVNQFQPIQRETPLWHPLPASESVTVAMPKGSAYRCIVTPLAIRADANDFGTKLEAWILKRELRCSVDGWRSWTVHPHEVRLLRDGTHELISAGEMMFAERSATGELREAFVLVRHDQERRKATTGPPQVLSNVPADD
jgi:hypothetical protein